MAKTAFILPTMLASALILGACATGPRGKPPAPVERVTPLTKTGSDEPADSAPKSKSAPVAPVPQGTQTYAYREPGTEPEPEPAAESESAANPLPADQDPAVESAPAAAAAAPQAPSAAPEHAGSPAPVTTPGEARATAASEPESTSADKVAMAAPPQPAPVSALPEASPSAPEVSTPSAAPLVAGLPPAADALARQAEQQRQMGDYAGAAASLERSMRIAPREPYLWNRLARVRLEQGLSTEAGTFASRSNSLGADPGIRKDNWRIIAESRRRAGDVVGAGEAERQAGGG